MFLPEGLNWQSSSHWSTSITIKQQTLWNQFAPVCSSVCEVVSLWLTRWKLSFSLPVCARRDTSLAFWDASTPEISIESDKVRDWGEKVDKSGCSRSWREKWFGRKWIAGAGTKAQFRSYVVHLETSSKLPLQFLLVWSAPLSACFLSFSQSLSDTPRSLLFIFYLISLVSLLHFYPQTHTQLRAAPSTSNLIQKPNLSYVY